VAGSPGDGGDESQGEGSGALEPVFSGQRTGRRIVQPGVRSLCGIMGRGSSLRRCSTVPLLIWATWKCWREAAPTGGRSGGRNRFLRGDPLLIQHDGTGVASSDAPNRETTVIRSDQRTQMAVFRRRGSAAQGGHRPGQEQSGCSAERTAFDDHRSPRRGGPLQADASGVRI